MKITAKTTKEQLKNILGANAKAVKEKDKDLYDRIAYADKMAKTDDSKVTRKDLVDLVKDTMKLLGDALAEPALAEEKPAETPAEPKAENSVKKTGKGLSKKQKSMEEPKEEPKEDSSEEVVESGEETAQTEEKVDKKSAKKSLGGKKKKEAPKKDGVTALEGSENQKTVQMAKQFPQTIEVADSKYELAQDIQSMEDLYTALENDEEIVFAYYWTKRHLRQFPYFNGMLGQPKSFDNDLDLANAIYVSEEKKVCYQVSMYTEAIYTILPSDIASEDGVRITCGIEFEIYRAV